VGAGFSRLNPARRILQPAYFDVAIGRVGSDDHSLHDPAYNLAP
jgi:hypothetical protein